MHKLRILAVLVCLLYAAVFSHAQLYSVQASCSATVAVPVAREGASVFVRSDAEPWRPLSITPQEGRIVIALDPTVMPTGRAMLLVNPPPGMDINDQEAPGLTALRVDSTWLEPAEATFLGVSKSFPRRVVFVARDLENPLSPESVRVTLNGKRLDRVRLEKQADGSLWVRAKLPPVDYGNHEVQYEVSDTSPQRNVLRGTIKFARQDLNNFALAAHGTTIKVDSAFSGYDNTTVLQDGVTTLPGDTLPGTLTWASEEMASPHWVELDFGRERTVREITVYWANYTDRLNTSHRVEVQIPRGSGWHTVYASPETGETPAQLTTFGFEPVTTQRIRIWQPAAGGGVHRPNLMWMAEVEAR